MVPTTEQLDVLAGQVRELFLQRNGTMEDFYQIQRYALAMPESAPAEIALPADEADKRLRLLHRFAAFLFKVSSRPRNYSTMALAIVATLPLHQLQSLETREFTLTEFTYRATDVVRLFLQRGDTRIATDSQDNAVKRLQSEADLCLQRDGHRCILTGTPNPHACHIFPFSGNNSDRKIDRVFTHWSAYKAFTNDRAYLLVSGPGCTDRAWNMVSLSPSLHSWWRRGYFSFRCLGVGSAVAADAEHGVVHMQLQWLPRRTAMQNQIPEHWEEETVALDDYPAWVREWESRPCYGSSSSDGAGTDAVLAVPHPVTSRLLQTGHTFHVTLPSREDAENMKTMLDLQWACLKIASMSGVTGDLEFLINEHDDDNEAAATVATHAIWQDLGVEEEEFYSTC